MVILEVSGGFFFFFFGDFNGFWVYFCHFCGFWGVSVTLDILKVFLKIILEVSRFFSHFVDLGAFWLLWRFSAAV